MHGRFKRTKNVLKLFQPKNQEILGIDITSTSVKILELSRGKDGLVIKNYGRKALPQHAIDGGVIKDIDAISQCINNVLTCLHTSCMQAVLALPDAAVISKVIQINQGLNEQEMEELILSETDKYLPYSINEINLDFEVLGPSEQIPGLFDVLLVASRAEHVNIRVEIAARAGLDAIVMDVESYAVERAAQKLFKELLLSKQNRAVAIVDIGTTYTRLFVMREMKLIYSREEKFGSKELIKMIVEHYKLTTEEAEILREKDELPPDYEEKVLSLFRQDVVLQIKRALQFFYSASQDEEVDHILLAGGLARLPRLASLIQERLRTTTMVINPFSFISPGKIVNLDSIYHDAPAFMTACGLALRNIR